MYNSGKGHHWCGQQKLPFKIAVHFEKTQQEREEKERKRECYDSGCLFALLFFFF